VRLIVAVLAIATVLPVSPSLAQSDRWTVRGRAIAVVADDDSETVADTGSAIAVDSSFGAEIGVTYLVLPQWGLELSAWYAPLDLSTVGGNAAGLDVGSVDLLSATLSVQYRFQTESRFDPYVGVGIALAQLGGYAATSDMVAAGIADITFSNIFRLFTQFGADVEIGKGWLLNVDLRYMPMTTQMDFITAAGASLDKTALDLNPFLISLGIGRSF
jgi:outer membrane protein